MQIINNCVHYLNGLCGIFSMPSEMPSWVLALRGLRIMASKHDRQNQEFSKWQTQQMEKKERKKENKSQTQNKIQKYSQNMQQ